MTSVMRESSRPLEVVIAAGHRTPPFGRIVTGKVMSASLAVAGFADKESNRHLTGTFGML
jgi:hypothetical protein